MIPLGKYMYGKFLDQKGKTKVVGIFSWSSGDRLGTVKWYGPWRQYCFYPEPDTVFNDVCLAKIIGFLATLNAEHRQKRGKG